MTFAIANFTPIGGQSRRGKAPQMFAYATTDGVTTIDGNGYFNGGSAASAAYGGVYNHLEIGDIIFAVVHTTSVGSGTVSDAGVFIVVNKSAGFVDVTNAVDLFVTDAD